MGMSRGSPVGMKSRLRMLGMAERLLPRQDRPEARRPGRAPARPCRLPAGRRRPGVGRRRSTSMQQGPLAGPGAGGGQVEGRGALAVARLGAGHQQGDDRAAAVGDAQQAGPDVAEGVGLDRVGRARGPEVPAPVRQRGAADPRAPRPGAAGSAPGSRARGPSPSGPRAPAGRPGRSPGPGSRSTPMPMYITRLGRIGTVGSTTLVGVFTRSFCDLERMSKPGMFRSISMMACACRVPLLDQRQEPLVPGHRVLHLRQDRLVLGLVVLELGLVPVQDHRGRVRRQSRS